jgi:hypothetical protein
VRRVAAILVTLTLLLPAATLFAAKPLPCCCKAAKSCPLQKGKGCGGCSMSRAMPHPAPANIPFETRWTVETPFTLAPSEAPQTFRAAAEEHELRVAHAPNTPPPRLFS